MQLSEVINHNETGTGDDFLDDVLTGLGYEQKALLSKYFYDDTGSRYFDEICELEEYYPYRTELKMLPEISRDISDMISDDIELVEFGAGSLVKVRPVLDHLGSVKRYVPVDIAGGHLLEASSRLCEEYDHQDIEIMPVEADFTNEVQIPASDIDTKETVRLGFFPGSTIGNFSPDQSVRLLNELRLTLGTGAWLLIGVDTRKAPSILNRAYNDAAGVTAMFNKNMLSRINRELDGNFDLEKFTHYAFYNETKGRIEMHLVSTEDQVVTVNGEEFSFYKGETIHTENSYKYSPGEFVQLAENAGWTPVKMWQDDDKLFSHHLLYAGEF